MATTTLPAGYRDVPEDDRKKAKVFFDRGKTIAATGNYDYAIEMYIQGLTLDPDAIDAHQELRDISLKRKAGGGKTIGMFDGMKLKRPTKDDKLNMTNAEKLLAFDPGNTDYMQLILQNAHRGGYFDTVMWVGPILQKANADDKKPDFNKFIVLKDVYKALSEWKLAGDACHYALLLHADDMELQTELKNLGAQHTMTSGRYNERGSFRDSVRDMKKQQKHMIEDKDVKDSDSRAILIAEAEAECKADPTDPTKVMRLVDRLDETDMPEFENRALALLEQWFTTTKQFRFHQRIGRIKMKQLGREERVRRAALNADPNNEDLRKEYAVFRHEQYEYELAEYEEWSRHYPTDMTIRFEMSKRLFLLHRFQDAIPVLQLVRSDPKYKFDAGILLGQAFLEGEFHDEAEETLGVMIREYQFRGDAKSKEMHYWRGRVLELKNQPVEAVKLYSQVAQWDWNYRDVQVRIKKLRS